MPASVGIRVWPDAGNLADIEYLAFMHLDFGSLPVFPNLKAMFSCSAGVESFVNHPNLPNAPICKIEPPGGDPKKRLHQRSACFETRP